MIQAVWPYWVIFERSMQQIFLQKYLKYMPFIILPFVFVNILLTVWFGSSRATYVFHAREKNSL